MKKFFLIFALLVSLVSCRVTYVEVYYLQKYPVTLIDTIYSKPTHWHYRSCNETWECLEIPADTFYLTINDTLCERTYMGTYKKKEHDNKWDIKNLKCDGKKCD
jgi:hypothetical protein